MREDDTRRPLVFHPTGLQRLSFGEPTIDATSSFRKPHISTNHISPLIS
jgi:hypothetical protein